MTRTNSPQGKETPPPWPIDFSIKDLLVASWGSKKGADLLWHFLNKVRWEMKNQKLPVETKVIKFQESSSKLFESMKDSGHSISLGTYHSFLHCFVAAGYVCNEPYSSEFEIHLDVIEKAFSEPPQKPEKEGSKPKQQREKSFNLKDCNFVTLPVEDYEKLIGECFKLKEMFQSLKDEHAQMLGELKEMFQSLKLSKSPESASQDALPSTICLQSNALENRENDSEFFGAHESDPVAEDQQSTEEKNSYSQNTTPTNENETQSHFEVPTFYAGLPVSWLQETTNTKQSPSQVSVPTLQVAPPIAEPATSLFPTEEKPAKKYDIPANLTADLHQRDPRQISKAEQKRIDAAAKREEESRVKGREEDLWRLAEKVAGVVVKTKYAIDSIQAMAQSKMPLEDIEIIMQKYADAGVFDLTKIANYLPTYAARKQRKQTQEAGNITPFPNRYQSPQQEVRIVKANDASRYGAHLNAADYDEEPVRISK